MSELADFATDEVTVRTLLGTGGAGKTWAAPVTHAVFVDEARHLVRGPDAREVVSEATVYDLDATHVPAYRLGSEVTLPSGRVAVVLAVRSYSAHGALDLPAHVEVSLT